MRVNLPRGVSIELSREWMVFSSGLRQSLDAYVQSNLDPGRVSPGEDSELSFAANLYDINSSPIGLVNVRYYPYETLTQWDVQAASLKDIGSFDALLAEQLRAGVRQVGGIVEAWDGTRRVLVNGISVLLTDYTRSSLGSSGSSFRVRLIRVLAGPRSFTLTVSYALSEGRDLERMADQVIASLQIEATRTIE